jgi:hypothetical protein
LRKWHTRWALIRRPISQRCSSASPERHQCNGSRTASTPFSNVQGIPSLARWACLASLNIGAGIEVICCSPIMVANLELQRVHHRIEIVSLPMRREMVHRAWQSCKVARLSSHQMPHRDQAIAVERMNLVRVTAAELNDTQITDVLESDHECLAGDARCFWVREFIRR